MDLNNVEKMMFKVMVSIENGTKKNDNDLAFEGYFENECHWIGE